MAKMWTFSVKLENGKDVAVFRQAGEWQRCGCFPSSWIIAKLWRMATMWLFFRQVGQRQRYVFFRHAGEWQRCGCFPSSWRMAKMWMFSVKLDVNVDEGISPTSEDIKSHIVNVGHSATLSPPPSSFLAPELCFLTNP